MALVSMNTGDARALESYTPDNCPCIYLNDDQCEALGITTPPAAGATIMLTCRAEIKSVTQEVESDGDDTGNDVMMTLRITDMEINNAPSSSSGSLYD